MSRKKKAAARGLSSRCRRRLLATAAAPGGWAGAAVTAGRPTDAVLDWNRHALEALVNAASRRAAGAGQTPPVSALHLAMVQGAVYDAVNSIDGGYQPYLDGLPPAPASASHGGRGRHRRARRARRRRGGAAAGAGDRRPARRRSTRTSLAAIVAGRPGGSSRDRGRGGRRRGDARRARRRRPLRAVRVHEPATDPGEWRPHALCTRRPASDPFAWVAQVEPFLLESPSQFRTKGPRALTSGAYAKDYNEVKALGGPTGSRRTPAQEAVAQFYNVTPVELFNRAFRTVAVDEGLPLVEQARLFAMLNLAGADG